MSRNHHSKYLFIITHIYLKYIKRTPKERPKPENPVLFLLWFTEYKMTSGGLFYLLTKYFNDLKEPSHMHRNGNKRL